MSHQILFTPLSRIKKEKGLNVFQLLIKNYLPKVSLFLSLTLWPKVSLAVFVR
jgi:hypothetical protein